MKKILQTSRLKRFFASFFACLFLILDISVLISPNPAFAIPEQTATSETQPTEETKEDQKESENAENICSSQSGAIGWIICPGTGAIAKAIDAIYSVIEKFLKIDPLKDEKTSTIHLVWEAARDLTNIVFIVFLLIVIYSQLTGIGIGNYGIKRVLPRIIVVSVLINLSYIICQIGVDVSNILGSSLRGFFTSIQETAILNGAAPGKEITWTELVNALTGSGLLATLGITITGGFGAFFWTILPIILGGLISIIIGLATIAMRQALVALLVMIAPLAFVCFLFPNTEVWFKKWKDLLVKMLIFYPVFSILYGASELAGWAIICSAGDDGFGIILGLAVQIFPLFFSWSLMKMSGTVLGTINQKLHGVAARPLGAFQGYAAGQAIHKRQRYFANSNSVGASLRRYSDYRTRLRAEDTMNYKSIYDSDIAARVQKKLAGGDLNTEPSKYKTTAYTRTAKKARNSIMTTANTVANTNHVLNNYGSYHNKALSDYVLNEDSKNAFKDSFRATMVNEIDAENDVQFLTDQYLTANKRDKNNNPIDQVAFNRYIESVGGPDGEQRVLGKVIAQASRIEAKQRAEFAILHNKFGHNGYNKATFRSWITGYQVDDDGWALDEHGQRLKDEHGHNLETIRGDALTKAPERLVLYDKRDDYGLYYDMKDQDGNIIARLHRGKGADGLNHDDGAFIKETLSNYDIPIGDPINDVYNILSGIKQGDIVTPQGANEIGLSRYSTTIGRAGSTYKGNAAWAGAMFNQMVANRQIHNSAQMAVDICDSIIKTSKPGALNTQNPASIALIRTILDPNNWEAIFTENELINGGNINDKLWGGEDWVVDDEGHPIFDENGNIQFQKVDNPTYEQRMNTLKRKYLFPAMEKVVPSVIRNSSPNTVDNQKPGAADEWSQFIDMLMDRWVDNPDVPDPNIRKYDLLNQTAELKAAQRDREGNPIYPKIKYRRTQQQQPHDDPNPLNTLHNIYAASLDRESLENEIMRFLEAEGYDEALGAFDDFIISNSPTMEEIGEYIDSTLAPFFTE